MAFGRLDLKVFQLSNNNLDFGAVPEGVRTVDFGVSGNGLAERAYFNSNNANGPTMKVWTGRFPCYRLALWLFPSF